MGDKTFKTHLDGYNFMPYFKGEVAKGPRREFFYFTDNGDLMAVRYDDWKVSFKTIKGNLFTGTEESTNVPLVTNLRQDPWERYQEESTSYGRWWGDKLWTWFPASPSSASSCDVQGISAQPEVRQLRHRSGPRCCKREPSRTDLETAEVTLYSLIARRRLGRRDVAAVGPMKQRIRSPL